jgi:hypothetical protein
VTRGFNRAALLLCVTVYTAGMVVLIAVARKAPLRVITQVRVPLTVYLLIVVTCLACMLAFSRRVGRAGS